MIYLHSSQSSERPVSFTTIFCDQTLWLHESSWETQHHSYFVSNRNFHPANIFLPNRFTQYSSRWVFLFDHTIQGWAEFHMHKGSFSINHLILSHGTNWAENHQTSIAYLLASLFQTPGIDIIEIPQDSKSTFLDWGEIRLVQSPNTCCDLPFQGIHLIQIQSQWTHETEIGRKATQRIRPMLSTRHHRHGKEQKKRRPRSRLFFQ